METPEGRCPDDQREGSRSEKLSSRSFSATRGFTRAGSTASPILFTAKRWYTTARLISHFSRWITGIEIHPGATIGRRVFIDHGMGVVIGETSEIGDDCLIYKGVVLGGTTLEKKKRHPTLGNRVVVGSNSTILGAITIGDGARIGSNSVVVKPVPPGATVVGVPGRIVESLPFETRAELDFEHGNLPDPLSDLMKMLLQLHSRLEDRIKRLENQTEKNR